MTADLHTHSSASDGQYRPEELAALGKKRGLQVLALTDHDTISGTEAAAQAGRRLGLRVLRGVELSARERRNLHILGIGFPPEPPELAALCAQMQQGRDQRKFRILDLLQEKGLPLTLEEVESFAGGQVVARPHFARAMVCRGYVSSVQEAFDRYLDTEEYRRIERPKPSARTCVETIRASGGVSSLAHPYQLRLEEDELDALVRRLAGYGLDAMECFYPRHSPEQTALYLRLARKYGLHVTGGSDFHGEQVKPDIQLAAWDLELDWLPPG